MKTRSHPDPIKDHFRISSKERVIQHDIIITMRTGKIIPNGVRLETHEYDTILFFTNLGKNIELIPPSNTPGNRRADFLMNLKQSCNVVIDLRLTKSSQELSLATHLSNCFSSSKKAKRMLIITKQEKLLDYKK